jgi:hypothetical protein
MNNQDQKIVINKIEPQTVELYTPDNISLGFVNEYEFNDIRIQIKQKQVDGYYCMFNGHRFNIDKNGRSKDWVVGFFDLFDNQLDKLI